MPRCHCVKRVRTRADHGGRGSTLRRTTLRGTSVCALKQERYVTFAILPAFETTLDQTTYRIDPRPVHLAMLGASILVVLLVALVSMARRRSGALVSPVLLALATVPAALIAFVYILKD